MGTIAISEDEERFAFFADDSQSKSNLVVCKMGSDKKLKRNLKFTYPLETLNLMIIILCLLPV